MKVKKDY